MTSFETMAAEELKRRALEDLDAEMQVVLAGKLGAVSVAYHSNQFGSDVKKVRPWVAHWFDEGRSFDADSMEECCLWLLDTVLDEENERHAEVVCEFLVNAGAIG